jgi:hypothetical protein
MFEASFCSTARTTNPKDQRTDRCFRVALLGGTRRAGRASGAGGPWSRRGYLAPYRSTSPVARPPVRLSRSPQRSHPGSNFIAMALLPRLSPVPSNSEARGGIVSLACSPRASAPIGTVEAPQCQPNLQFSWIQIPRRKAVPGAAPHCGGAPTPKVKDGCRIGRL